jgi:transcriptional regulator CtsR
MRLSDLISQEILAMIDNSEENIAEIQRNDFAERIGCVPSQINYVLSSRFTPEHGFMIESRRGGGGYIKITRIKLSESAAIMHIINSINSSIDLSTARIIIENCIHSNLISAQAANLISAALSGNVFRTIPPESRGTVRAALLKQMFISLL